MDEMVKQKSVVFSLLGFFVGAVISAIILSLTGTSSSNPVNQLSGPVRSQCDGTTLIYSTGEANGGIAVIPNSPRCKK